MPRGDGTGPMGMGPMTGRGAGYCAGYATPGFMNPYGARPAGMAAAYGFGPPAGAPSYPGAMPMGPGYGVGGYAPYGGPGMPGFGMGRGRGFGRGMGRGGRRF